MAEQRFFDISNRSDMPFQIILGGRGIGKTYSALDYLQKVSSPSHKFIYMRREGTEIDQCATEYGNPYKKLNEDKGYHIEPFVIPKFKGFGFERQIRSTVEPDEVLECEPIGYAIALSTFSGTRSMDYSDVDIIFFDEFIPERHKRKIKAEGDALFNIYETVNRNRELLGEKPVKLILSANGIDLANPILAQFEVISVIQNMLKNNQYRRTIPERKLYIELVHGIGITEEKKKTVLYQLANENFVHDTLNTDFREAELHLVKKSKNLNGYKPELGYGNYVIFSSKTDFYIKESNVPCKMKLSEKEIYQLRAIFGPRYRLMRASQRIFFDDYTTLVLFDEILAYDL